MAMSRKLTSLAVLGVIASAASLSLAQRPAAQRQPGTQPGAQNQNPNTQPQPGTSNRAPQNQRPVTQDDANAQRPVFQDQTTTSGGFVVASQVMGAPVQSADGQQIGTMADVLLTVQIAITPVVSGAAVQPAAGNTQATAGANANATTRTPGAAPFMGTNVYALINVDAFAQGRVAIIPWELLHYANGTFIIGFDMNRLSEVPSVMQGDPRLMEGMEWAQQVDGFFQDDLRQIRAARPDLDNIPPNQQSPTQRQPGVTPADPTPGTPGATPPRAPGNQPGTTPPPRTSQPGANPTQPGTAQPGASPAAPANPTP